MKIAWVIGSSMKKKVFQDVSNEQKDSGGWVYTQLELFEKVTEIKEIVIISITNEYEFDESYASGKAKVFLIKDNPIRLIPNKVTFQKIDDILIREKVELVDIQGIETTISAYPLYTSISVPFVNTIHGIAYQCYKFYSMGLPCGFLLFGRSLHDWITFHGILEGKLLMKRRSNTEKRLLKRISIVRGRTEWDKVSILTVNPKLTYYKVELVMREPFYNACWSIDSCAKNRIFVPQMRIPYKGLFILLEAIQYVVMYYPDIHVCIPGAVIRSGLKQNGYEKYINRYIKNKKLTKNIEFLGNLSAKQMADELVKARLFVMPSIIENSPNSLIEAQMVGTPSVASLVGGVQDYVTNGENGLLYNSLDPIMCAECIIKLLNDDTLSKKISRASRDAALRRHDPETITKSLVDCYKTIMEN